MYGLVHIEVLLKLLCLSSFENKNLNFAPDICPLNRTSYEISQSSDTHASELCLENECFPKDSGRLTATLVDTDLLMSLISNFSDCNVCLNEFCYKDAFEILSNLNEDVNPCDDFYKFACGGWLNRQTIPKDKSYVSVYSKLEDDIQLQLKDLLEKETENDPDYIQMVKGIYQSCIDIDSVNESGIESFKNFLKELGGWPVVEGENWDPKAFDWIDTLIKIRRKGFNHDIFIGLSIVKDPYNSTVHVIKLDQPSLGLDRHNLLGDINNKERRDYFNLMLKAAYVLSTNDSSLLEFSSANIDAISISLGEAFLFEVHLAELFSSHKYRERYTVKKLMYAAEEVDWLKYFNGLIYARIFTDENLFVDDINYIEQFASYISGADKRVVANYMIWRVVQESLPLLSKEWRTLGQRTVDKPDVPEKEPRWEQCLSSLMNYFEVAINAYYVRNYSNNREKKNYAEYMMSTVKFILENIIMQNEWMDKVAKEMALDKAKYMKLHLSYPDRLLNDTDISELYENLKFGNESYFDKAMKVRKWSTDKSFSHLRTPQKYRWVIKHRTPDGYILVSWEPMPIDEFPDYANGSSAKIIYKYHANRIELPAGILQQAFFNKDRPHSLNWGAVGFKLAREMSQAFFDEGRWHDKDGKKINWWRPDVQQNFERISSCFRKQYSNYTEDDYGLNLKVEGMETQEQNIADNAGLKVAYLAYKHFVETSKNEMLPWVKYTPDQLFWIGAANAMCEKQTKEYLDQQLRSKSYVPPKFRVIGAMSNLQEFSKDFNCPSGSPMNPKEKCEIW